MPQNGSSQIVGRPRDEAERGQADEQTFVRAGVLEHAVPDEQQTSDEQRQRDARHEEERLGIEPRHVPEPRRQQDGVTLLRAGRVASAPFTLAAAAAARLKPASTLPGPPPNRSDNVYGEVIRATAKRSTPPP